MTTKNDLYAFLTKTGSDLGYSIIPEFRVSLPNGRKKEIDLVWSTRREPHLTTQTNPDLEHWKLAAAFEIEGCNVRRLPNEFNRHVNDFGHVMNLHNEPILKFMVLYTAAFDRIWDPDTNRNREVTMRLQWETGGAFTVVDGRQIINGASAGILPPRV